MITQISSFAKKPRRICSNTTQKNLPKVVNINSGILMRAPLHRSEATGVTEKNCLHRSGGHSDQKNGRIWRHNVLLCKNRARPDGRWQDSVCEKLIEEI